MEQFLRKLEAAKEEIKNDVNLSLEEKKKRLKYIDGLIRHYSDYARRTPIPPPVSEGDDNGVFGIVE